MVTKPRGGPNSVSTRCQSRFACGSRRAAAVPQQTKATTADTVTEAARALWRAPKRLRYPGISADDFVAPARSQSAQRIAEHRSAHRRGKRQSRANAFRHGLTAETVVARVEDVEDYKAFEAAVIADYDARTAVERELVLRLASLLWRLRRATSIETDLLNIQAEILRDGRLSLRAPDAEHRPHNGLEHLNCSPPAVRADNGRSEHG